MSFNATKSTLTVSPTLSYFELKWNAILDQTTDNPILIYCVGVHIFLGVVYWTIGAFFVYFDLFNPKWIQKYKLQPDKNDPVDREELKQVIQQVLYNQFVLAPYISIVTYPFLMMFGLDQPEIIRTLPSFHTLVLHVGACIVMREILFYYSHRLLHTRYFYEKFHKRHHHWTAPIAVSAQYAGELEHYLSNLTPIMIPVAVLQCHLFTTLVFFIHVNLRTLNDHSGYHFPYYYNSERHDKHHEIFNQYYGIIGLMDWLHGTDKVKIVRKKSNKIE